MGVPPLVAVRTDRRSGAYATAWAFAAAVGYTAVYGVVDSGRTIFAKGRWNGQRVLANVAARWDAKAG